MAEQEGTSRERIQHTYDHDSHKTSHTEPSKVDYSDTKFTFPKLDGLAYGITDSHASGTAELSVHPFKRWETNDFQQEQTCYKTFFTGKVALLDTIRELLQLFTRLAYSERHAAAAFRLLMQKFFNQIAHLFNINSTARDMLTAMIDENLQHYPIRD